ncbi:DNA (cytosine-5-)-methyltransferase [Sporosarcina sp. P21c]|uniref:DNA cytosine methyltransferase n=1 Tax=Sporosarcina sp. P21c TaxID=2048255 RepID=UPI000C162B8F|nr:DNA cytosine methyltransferase [Sporosarcina sp. P21c]PIC88550.1 DNA (cytosine-5-)-methyltransferase [Sporosarcina sp. P21c]
MKRKAISLFTGAGGLDIGIKRAGFDVKIALEIEPVYCETLRTNFPNLIVKQGDVMEYSRKKLYEEAGLSEDDEIDLIIGGSPCQSFSTAGKRQAFEDPRGQAMIKFADLVQEVQPKVFLLENVKGLLSSSLKHVPISERNQRTLEPDEQQGSAFKHLLKHFGNYIVTDDLLNAADYGVAQTRERVFIVGVRSDLNTKYIFPKPTHEKNGLNGKCKWRTVADILNELDVQKHSYVKYSADRLRWMQMIPKGGGNWRDLRSHGEEIVKEAMGGAYESGGGKVGFFRRVNVNKPAPTLLTSPIQKSTNLGHPFEDRPLSIEEYIKIQEFPKDYYISGSLSQQYTQIGNAVPTRLGQILGESIIDMLNKNEKLQKL